jgi:lysophospholipase L1-like esterase
VLTPLLATALLFSAPPPEPLPPGAVLPPAEPVDHARLGVAVPIENPPGRRALTPFFESLVKTLRGEDDPSTPTREDQTRVVVWGASHVAGDVFTRSFRHALKERYGDAGIGLLVPARPWRGYHNRDANLSYSKNGWDSFWVSRRHNRDDGLYGLGGITFTSKDKKAWFEVSTAKVSPFGRNADIVEIWYERCERCGDFIVEIDGKKAARVKTKADAGRGRPAGFAVFEKTFKKSGSRSVRVRPAGNGPVTFYGVVLDDSAPGVVVDTLGINGSRATDHLEWDAALFSAQLLRRDPDLVVLAYGTNAVGDNDDLADYRQRLETVLSRLRAVVPRAACLFVGPSDRPVKVEGAGEDGDVVQAFLPRERQEPFIDVQRKAAHRYGCAYWDWAAAMGGVLSVVRWAHADVPLATKDYVHLTRAGYERIGQLFWDALMGPFEVPGLPPAGGPSIRGGGRGGDRGGGR